MNLERPKTSVPCHDFMFHRIGHSDTILEQRCCPSLGSKQRREEQGAISGVHGVRRTIMTQRGVVWWFGHDRGQQADCKFGPIFPVQYSNGDTIGRTILGRGKRRNVKRFSERFNKTGRSFMRAAQACSARSSTTGTGST